MEALIGDYNGYYSTKETLIGTVLTVHAFQSCAISYRNMV